MKHIWVDPVRGSDERGSGARAAPLRSLAAAWDRVPTGTSLTRGIYIHLMNGTLPGEGLWVERKWGTRAAPIIVASETIHRAVVRGLSLYNCRHVYFMGVKFVAPWDHPLHLASCVNILVRKCKVLGECPRGWRMEAGCQVKEALKANQMTGLWVEDSEIAVSWYEAFDCVACAYGHVLRSNLHHASWCGYVKGGSAYWVLAGNRVHHCYEAGLSAGQGAGFQFYVPPWIRYQANDVKIYNNLITDIDMTALRLLGCHNCLIAHNTCLRVGNHPDYSSAILVDYGSSQCDGLIDARCTAHHKLGGWGPVSGDDTTCYLPSANNFIANNLVVNPPGWGHSLVHLQLAGPMPAQPACNLPGPAAADKDLFIRGNLFWNGPRNLPTGAGVAGGCMDRSPTCRESQLRRDNYFNSLKPAVNLTTGRLTVRMGAPGSLANLTKLWRTASGRLPSFGYWQGGPGTPKGTMTNNVPRDRDGASRSTNPARNAPGAYLVPAA